MSVRGKSMMKIILVIVYLILTTLGVVLMKKGGNPGSLALEESTLKFGISIVSAIGLLCYICSFLLYTRIVVMFDLSYIVPICTGIVQILTLIAAAIVFKEQFHWNNVLGASAVIIGLILMNIKFQK